MLLPFKSKNPPESFPIVTIVLIVINVIVYAFTTEYGLFIKESVLDQWAFKSSDFPSITMVTAMFLHVDPFHLLGNMFFLYLFGFAVEGRMRSIKFIALYFAAGLCGDLLHHFLVGINDPDVPGLGASGAIMGVLGAAMYIFPHAKIKMFYWFWMFVGVAEWSLWAVGCYYLAFDFLFALIGLDTGVANLAHLGGAAGGFLVAFLMRVKRDDAYASDAKASLSDFGNMYALRPYEVQQIALTDPTNSDAALAWLWTSVNAGGRAPTEECLAHFEKHLPKLVRTGGVRELAMVLGEYGGKAGRFHPRYALDVGLRAEREAEPQAAMRLLEAAVMNPHVSGNDKETATFQLAMLHETWFQNYGAAAHLYQRVMTEFAGSPLADQAAIRHKIVAPMAQQSGSYTY